MKRNGYQISHKIQKIAKFVFQIYHLPPLAICFMAVLLQLDPLYYILEDLDLLPISWFSRVLTLLLRLVANVAVIYEGCRIVALLIGLMLTLVNTLWRLMHMWGKVVTISNPIGLMFY